MSDNENYDISSEMSENFNDFDEDKIDKDLQSLLLQVWADEKLDEYDHIEEFEEGKANISEQISVIGSEVKEQVKEILDGLQVPRDTRATQGEKQILVEPNTYRLKSIRPFRPNIARKIIGAVVRKVLKPDSIYDHLLVREQCDEIGTKIVKVLQKMDFERYKLVCLVDIVEKANASLITGFSTIRNAAYDQCAGCNFRTKYIICSVYVFGFYYE